MTSSTGGTCLFLNGLESVWADFWAVPSASKHLFRCIFVSWPLTCSSQICILAWLMSTTTKFPVQFWSLVKMFPNTLNSLSYDTELAEIESSLRANVRNTELSCEWPGIEYESRMTRGSGCCFCKARRQFKTFWASKIIRKSPYLMPSQARIWSDLQWSRKTLYPPESHMHVQ